jgi:ankyrin repeat protein
METTIPAMTMAIWNHSIAEVKRIAASDPSAVNDVGSGLSPLHEAARINAFKIGRILLDHGADPSIRGDGDNTALHYAALGGNTAFCRLLVQRGAELDSYTTNDVTPLGMSLFSWADGAAACAKLLRKAGAKEDLVSAIYSYDDEMIAVLVNATPWNDRQRQQVTRCVPDLLRSWSYEAQREWKPPDDDVEVLRRVVRKHLPTLDFLISAGAQIDSRGIVMPQTAAEEALSNSGHKDILIRILLERGANPNARHEGVSLLVMARRVWSDEAVSALREYGAHD